MLPDESDFSDSLTRARREHRHALQRRDDDAARLLQSAIAALEATTPDTPATLEPRPQMSVHEAAAQRIHACRPGLPVATIVEAVRHAMIALTVAAGEQPLTEQVEAFALNRLDQ